MFHELVSHNEDLRRLVDTGYAIKFDSSYLVVRDIPYLDKDRNLQMGAIVSKVVFVDQHRIRQEDHQIFFCGSHPHNMDGTPIPNLAGGSTKLALKDPTLVVERSFSNKPQPNGFQDFFEKIESYVRIISGPATQIHGVSPLTYRVDTEVTSGSVFKFHDTLTSRAEIGDLAKKFGDEVVAILGLGGTGAYILDLIVKTPVKEIRAFDLDAFHVHNAYRSPGRLLDGGELGKNKAEVYLERYTNFRSGLRVEPKFIDASCASDLDGVTFAFVCVDKGSSRSSIFDLLLSKRIPFIDVGMGLNRKRGPLSGMLRVTYYPAEKGAEVRAKQLAELVDAPDDEYRANIQTAELNAMNAALAVLRYKQVRGFYVDDSAFYNALFTVNDLGLHGESFE